jgi:molecular chaperone GrpE
MRKKKQKAIEAEQQQSVETEASPEERGEGGGDAVVDSPALQAESPDDAPGHDGMQLVEPPDEAIRRLKGELDTVSDRYLRLAAEFDNFRKRVTRERTELRARAQGDLVRRILDSLDDLTRVSAINGTVANLQDVVNGVDLVERKLLRELEEAGLERVGAAGEIFDPNVHEAVGTMPASEEAPPGTIGTVTQLGYRFGGTLLRPARVMVLVEDEPAGPTAEA